LYGTNVRYYILLLLYVFLLAGCAPSGPATESRQRLVSTAPSLTAIVYALGAGNRLVGVGTYCEVEGDHDPVRVGGYLDPDIETIVALEPDLVLAVHNPSLEEAADRFDLQLRKFGAQWHTIEDIERMIRDVATVLELAETGERLIASIREELASADEGAEGREPRSVLMVVERQPGAMMVVGPGSHLDELLQAAGASNAIVDGKAYQSVGIEEIVSIAPDVIIDITLSGLEMGDMQEIWSTWPSIPAVRHGRLHILTESPFVQPGPAIGKAAIAFGQMIYGTE
jgi:iron complex transport system substrate-binding protein